MLLKSLIWNYQPQLQILGTFLTQQRQLGTCEKTTLGTSAMSHSYLEGAVRHAYIEQEKSLRNTQCQPLRLSSLGTKHIESMIGSRMIQCGKMQRKIWDGEIHLCHTQEFMLVEEVWDSEWERVPQQSLPFTERSRHATLLLKRKLQKKHILQTWKNCLSLNTVSLRHCVPISIPL